MKILSLFDGIACGRVALERVNIQVDKYIASEIDPYAIKVAKYNYTRKRIVDIEEKGEQNDI